MSNEYFVEIKRIIVKIVRLTKLLIEVPTSGSFRVCIKLKENWLTDMKIIERLDGQGELEKSIGKNNAKLFNGDNGSLILRLF